MAEAKTTSECKVIGVTLQLTNEEASAVLAVLNWSSSYCGYLRTGIQAVYQSFEDAERVNGVREALKNAR